MPSPSTAITPSIFEMSYLLANLHVQEVMSTPVITVSEEAPLEEAARLMVEKKIGCLPVMRNGDLVASQGRPARAGEKYFSLLRIEAVNGLNPEMAKERPHFGSLTPTFPDKLINLETPANVKAARLINLIAPIGRGQRGLIVAPPKAGKTMLLKSIANCALEN